MSNLKTKHLVKVITSRESIAAEVLRQREGKLAIQRACPHKHPNGHTHAVLIKETDGGYILCQKNQCIIRSGSEPVGYIGTAIYNTELFNKLVKDIEKFREDVVSEIFRPNNETSLDRMISDETEHMPLAELRRLAEKQLTY